MVRFGRPYHHGLEAGSKPELLAVLAMLEDEEALIICNGYKDEEYVETALLGSTMGRTIILVVEKPSELSLIARLAKKTHVRPRIGVRLRLSTRGSGRWEASGGDHSKFGLSARELLEAIDLLKQHELLDTFELLHFHLGSQISNIRNIKDGLREAGRYYCELVKMGVPLRYLDVGGGLGVDYDGSQTNFHSSINYTLQEYANDVVYAVLEMCEEAAVPTPILVSESGRATVAHHCVLVTDILGVSEFSAASHASEPPDDAEAVVWNMYDTYRELTRKNLLEAYHDALQYKDETLTLFALGHLQLEQRVLAEEYFWGICQKILRFIRDMDEVPEELEALERLLADTYFCNFSLFQSIPDFWAVKQLFPHHAHPPSAGRTDAPRRAGRHHLRLGRQNRRVHRPARREAGHPAAFAHRRGLLPGLLPGRRLPGNSRRPAQPVRRHQHGARLHRPQRRLSSGPRRCRRHGDGRAELRQLLA